jgi:hypothetical protein
MSSSVLLPPTLSTPLSEVVEDDEVTVTLWIMRARGRDVKR